MAFDAVNFLQHYGIDHVTEGHKHCRPGWVQVKCPFCVGNPGWHLGFEMSKDWWNCWRCGAHRTWDVVIALLDGNVVEARKALQTFKGRPVARSRRERREDNRVLELPAGLQPLTTRARNYLQARNFDPDMLEYVWGLQSTTNIGELKYRVFIPIFVDNRMVSWQCRDITDTSGTKYIAQEEAKEIVCNKDTLYGLDQAYGRACVVVEGVTDVWRLGPGAVAVFGIKYRPSQVLALVSRFEEFFILFDSPHSDPQAGIQASKLASELSVLGGKSHLLELEEGDPGDLNQSDADELMRQCLGYSGY